ncbi:stage VI sporulation protein F [Bacillus sp. JJ664]|uniref:Sporulation-specific transcription factor SpoVIF n=1 Tax=Gottfriedia solisilvae TaxID=1516104 RepID=A0A8J3AE56_9BACI|nr:stage VI sporulation protein F [Gottfriedia solisilvae]GGI12239.1 sporulation-specific transcription factor SpoVIF [Gottfriedia solisilvae]
MSNNQNGFFDKIEKKANVSKTDIFKVADSVKDANFKDEATVRKLVRQIAAMTGRQVTKDKEDKIVQAIVTNNMPLDFQSLTNMFKQK